MTEEDKNKTKKNIDKEKESLEEWEKISPDDFNIGTKKEYVNKDLDQSEIDNLLGLDAKSQEKEVKGIRAMINKALDSYEKLPMLEVVFEKFIRLLSTSLRNFTQDNVDLEIKSIQSLRFGSYISSIPIPTLVSVFKAVEWDHYGLFIADSALIFSLVDILFGGKKSTRSMKIEGRAYTSIEQSLVAQLSQIVLKDLAQSFETLCNVEFRYDRMESDPRFASIARHSDSAILVKIAMEMEEKKGTIEILFPYEALEPIKELLIQVFIGDKFGGDHAWKNAMIDQIYSTNLKLTAYIEGKASILEDMMDLKVGSTVLMENGPEDDILLSCNNIRVATGKLGKYGSKLAIALNSEPKKYNPRED
jgi:flagellar motor switch protein FliM